MSWFMVGQAYWASEDSFKESSRDQEPQVM
jgi:hypothetical protein